MANTNDLREKDFPKGTRIRVRLGGTLQKSAPGFDAFKMEGCKPVRELDTPMAWTQFIYLDSSQVGGGREIGNTVTANFDARVMGDYGTGDINTTRVREIARSGSGMFEYQHFLFLPSLTVSIVKECTICQGPLSAVEASDPALSGYVHENDSDDTHVPVDPANPARGFIQNKPFGQGFIEAKPFDFSAANQYGFGAAAPAFGSAGVIDPEAIRATFLRDDYPGGVSFGSVSFDTTPDRKEPTVPPIDYLAELKAAVNPAARISINDEEILSAQVINRINELEDALAKAPGVAVLRTTAREGQLQELGAFQNFADAELFIDTEDFDRGRVTITGKLQNLNAEDTGELNRLRELSADGRATFGGPTWAAGVVLTSSSYFTEDWAKSLAVDELNIDRDDVDSWPLDLVDWLDAANDRLGTDYQQIRFDGENYYGPNV